MKVRRKANKFVEKHQSYYSIIISYNSNDSIINSLYFYKSRLKNTILPDSVGVKVSNKTFTFGE